MNAQHERTRGASDGPVLVVDDDPLIQEFVTMALEDDGYRVLTAVNGASIGLARTQRPALILLDQMMPQMDGVEVSRRLKADPATADIPIVLMSATRPLTPIQRAMQAVDRLPKPFELRELSRVVRRWAPPPPHEHTP